MRVFATVLLSISLAASPLLAANAGETGKEDTPAAATSVSTLPNKPTAVKTEAPAIESEVQDLRSLVEEQRAELEAQRAALKAQQLRMAALEEKLGGTSSESVTAPAAAPASTPVATPASTESASPVAPAAKSTMAMMAPQKEQESPLFFKIGGAEFYPLGFMDLTNVWRSNTVGTGIGTGFNSLPFANSTAGHVSEDRFSAQNSRIGLRTHAKFGDADVTGYLEADFLGLTPPNVYDTSNSNTLRMRLYWVDYRKGMFEMLGGQSWSLMTPNRNGLSAMPGDLFYSQDVDTNYQLGLTWARQAGVRFILHPDTHFAIGLSVENPQQTCPSGVIIPPGPAVNYGSQCDTNSGSLTGNGASSNTGSVANLHPDVIVKAAYDGGPENHHVHFDIAGLFRSFKAVNLITSLPNANLTNVNTSTDTIHGGGVAGTAYIELVKNFRFIGTAFYSSGGGRYIASTAGPDFIVRPDGNLSEVKSGSGIAGFEYQVNPKTVIYGYYSGAYFAKDVNSITSTVNTPATGTPTGTCTDVTNYGYGFGPGSATLATGTGTCAIPGGFTGNANRYMYEPTAGIHYTMWRNPSYGDLRLMTQFSYASRAPWYVNTPSVATPAILPTAHTMMVFIDLRYDLP
ncbi:MAG TPA: hypothetical protein VK709_10925 [Candidatus Saccharimonadales bacterium]|jgi:hypothetical protein|nr:hypothetical protein [Candidatus Saccharimonadales bacterium]